MIGIILLHLLICILFGMIIGVLCMIFLCGMEINRACIISVVVSIICAFLLFGIIVPIHADETSVSATVTKMEESVAKTSVHRHVYAVTDDGKGICINVDASNYALLNVYDKIELDRCTTITLFNIEDTSYTLKQISD